MHHIQFLNSFPQHYSLPLNLYGGNVHSGNCHPPGEIPVFSRQHAAGPGGNPGHGCPIAAMANRMPAPTHISNLVIGMGSTMPSLMTLMPSQILLPVMAHAVLPSHCSATMPHPSACARQRMFCDGPPQRGHGCQAAPQRHPIPVRDPDAGHDGPANACHKAPSVPPLTRPTPAADCYDIENDDGDSQSESAYYAVPAPDGNGQKETPEQVHIVPGYDVPVRAWSPSPDVFDEEKALCDAYPVQPGQESSQPLTMEPAAKSNENATA
ncbi:hypothetical protein [Martelella alba]|uniref:Uncharacterized protein n=1 Tax=Martelella alba TaxID=2590451 RepID=A0ABY2SQR2_9HYPH|nr:hypothetical protein [Martelella alba]TKI07156.1 hypothetical protein FCN80_06925 [Martelella alba]